MRIVKDPDVRRGEILDTAEQLFIRKGYDKTTIVDILDANDIAKGTFYHYFKSKEEVMKAVIDRIVETDVLRAAKIAADTTLTPLEKFYTILKAQQPKRGDQKDKMLEQFHHPSNAEMHQRSLVLAIKNMSPILSKIAVEGVKQGYFNTPYPEETVELLLLSGQLLFDDGMFQWEEGQYARRVEAFIHNMELVLGAETGSFNFMNEMLYPDRG